MKTRKEAEDWLLAGEPVSGALAWDRTNMANEKNPTFVPGRAVGARGCPKCSHDSFNGRNVGGVVTFTCAKCQNKWHGGLPQVPEDPTIPKAPVNPHERPSVSFVKDKNDQIVEKRRPVSAVPEFRKGLPLKNGDE